MKKFSKINNWKMTVTMFGIIAVLIVTIISAYSSLVTYQSNQTCTSGVTKYD